MKHYAAYSGRAAQLLIPKGLVRSYFFIKRSNSDANRYASFR